MTICRAGQKPHKFHNGNTWCFSKRTESTLFKRTSNSIYILAFALLTRELLMVKPWIQERTQVYLVLWVALLPRSECQNKPQPPCSIPTGAKSLQVQPVPKSPWPLWLGPPFTLQSSSQRRLNINHNRVGRMGGKTKAFLAVHSTLREPFMQLAYTGTFAQHPISVNLVIFLNMLEEETSWKRSVWNFSVTGKLCCFSKKSFLI